MYATFLSGAVAAALSVTALPATAQGQGESGAFIVRLGTDTLAFERFTITPERLSGTFVTRSPRTRTQRYDVFLAPDGSVRRFEIARFRGDGGGDQPDETMAIFFADGSVTVERMRDGEIVRDSGAAPAGTVPMMLNSYALLELVTRRHRPAGAPVERPGLFVGATSADTLRLEPGPADSIIATLGGIGPLRLALDGAGRIVGVNGVGGALNVTAARLPDLDVSALAGEFAARDAAGRGLGVLSPTDTVRATAAGAALTVVYGRPAARGRIIFGGVVLWDLVWRTGANQATHVTTDTDLLIEDVRIPAGTYTLWTIPSRDSWTLILNGQTGQGGTSYDAAHDIARIPMRVDAPDEPVERFTIAIEARGENGGRLVLSWERTRAWVAFRPAG